LTDDQILTIGEFSRKVSKGLAKAETDFATRRQIIDLLDVQVTLTIENGQKVVYARCKVGNETVLSIENTTSHAPIIAQNGGEIKRHAVDDSLIIQVMVGAGQRLVQ
jgi:hypothetical protein